MSPNLILLSIIAGSPTFHFVPEAKPFHRKFLVVRVGASTVLIPHVHTHEQAMSLSDGESFLHLCYARAEPYALLGHTAAPMSSPHHSRLLSVLPSSLPMRHQTPHILAAPARTDEDCFIVEAQSSAPVLSTSRSRSPSSSTRRVHPIPYRPAPVP
jgi:hypothetical protein